MTRAWAETLYDAYGQQFSIDKIYFESGTGHQHLLIFHNSVFGRVMALDGVVQTTQKDEFIYHEMLTHVPLVAHGRVHRALIIGGGDGGILREVCKHRRVEQITQVEIDQAVIDVARKYLPTHSDGAYDDPRANIVIADGVDFVSGTSEKFDLIISDSTDPIGPGEVLFTTNFYENCRRCLNPGGVLVTQNGVPFMQMDEVEGTARKLAPLFRDWYFYTAAVPTYIGGVMSFAWATDDCKLRAATLEQICDNYKASGIRTRYYTPEIHRASFALPGYMLQAIGKGELT